MKSMNRVLAALALAAVLGLGVASQAQATVPPDTAGWFWCVRLLYIPFYGWYEDGGEYVGWDMTGWYFPFYVECYPIY
jgi:peptidoglycan/LPS O-acetylase OafA/YrhL